MVKYTAAASHVALAYEPVDAEPAAFTFGQPRVAVFASLVGGLTGVVHRRPMVLASLSSSASGAGAAFDQWLQHAKQYDLYEEDSEETELERRFPVLTTAPRYTDVYLKSHRVFCNHCHRPVSSTEHARRGVHCEGCHRWLHDECVEHTHAALYAEHQPQASSAKDTHVFYCRPECASLRAHLSAQATPQPTELGSGRALVLMDLAPLRLEWWQARNSGVAKTLLPPASEGLKAAKALTRLFREHYNESLNGVLEDDYAALLLHNGAPVAGASFNVYWPDHARVQSLVTSKEKRGQGHCRALLDELHSFLSGSGLGHLVVVFEKDEAQALRLFQDRFGFKQVPAQQHSAWRLALPHYHKDLSQGRTLLWAPLRT